MSHPQAPSPNRDSDVRRRFVHDAKNGSEVASTDSETPHTSHDPHASYRDTPDLESESDEEMTAHATPDVHSTAASICIVSSGEPILTGLDRTGPRVRFRSRVRISAGMGRRRRLSDGLPSNASSISGSPSSSISAPLRTHYTGNNGWGPLGGRVSLLASQAAPPSPSRAEYATGGKGNGSGYENARRRSARSSQVFLDDDVDEHTHLMTSGTRHSYVGNRRTHDRYHDDGERERWWREQVVDEAFGKWPGRLLNGHWWWWHLEPILCCFCDPDEEE